MTMVSKITIIWFMLICQLSYCQNNINSLISELKNPEFYPNVESAKEKLEEMGKESIPELIKLLRDTTYVKLTGTVDLIYPRAENFAGHGNIIIYDINYISYRAGWVLEEITFKDFGFKIPFETIGDILNYGDSLKPDFIKSNRIELAEKVEKWWKKNKNNWNRINSLKKALKSKNEIEHFFALEYVNSNENYFPELTDEIFNKEIQPILTIVYNKSQKENNKNKE